MAPFRSQTSPALLPPSLQAAVPYFLLVLAVFAFYGNIYDNEFLYDDEHLIALNSYLQNWSSLGTIFANYVDASTGGTGHFYRPLQNVLYLIVFQMSGGDVFGFHLLNLLLHAANACLLFRLGAILDFHKAAVFLASLFWALHPLHVEAVTYMSATADVLFSFFCFLGLLRLLPDFNQRRVFSAVPCMVLGLLSKESAVVFPLLAMSISYLTSKQRWRLKPYLRTWPLWAVAIVYLAMRLLFLPFDNSSLMNIDPMSRAYAGNILLRIYTSLATLPSYLSLILWPVGLHMDRDYPVYMDPWHWQVFVGLTLVSALFMLLAWGRGQRAVALSWGMLWFAGAHASQTGIVVPVNSLFLEHWMYLPTAGLFLGIAETCASQIPTLSHFRLTAFMAGLCVALLLGYLTWKQNEIWRDPFSFYNNIFAHGEKSYRARNNLAIAYGKQRDFTHAYEQLRLCLQENDDYSPEVHQNMAYLLSQINDGRDRTKDIIAELERALAIQPDFTPASAALADVYVSLGDHEKADYYRKKSMDIHGPKTP